MFEALACIPEGELHQRHQRCRNHLAHLAPKASGLLVFSRPSIYYLTGTMAQGALWLPLEGEPLLFVRKGIERARLEAKSICSVRFRSYSDFATLAAEAERPFGATLAVTMTGLTWQLGQLLQKKLADHALVPGDHALTLTRSIKSQWELALLKRCGALHHQCLYSIIPSRIQPGMTEREIAHHCWQVFFEKGHQGLMRMQAHGEEAFLGHVAAGDSGNYPSSFNGPLGLRGEHPAAPIMGFAGKKWNGAEPLALDIGFVLDGYQTDKTQVYWAGEASSIPDTVRAAHDLCIKIQDQAAAMAKPGVTPEEIYLESLSLAAQAGYAEGFMGLGGNKVPFLGHGIGMFIDEYPVLARGFIEPLQEGMVLAIEPKVGLSGIGMVGVENTFEVTSCGAQSLTGQEFDMVAIG